MSDKPNLKVYEGMAYGHGLLSDHTLPKFRDPTVAEVVAWLRDGGLIVDKDWCVRHGSWMSLSGTCFSNPQRTECDPQPRSLLDLSGQEHV